MNGERRGSVLTDHHLVSAVSTSTVNAYTEAGRRVYTATFESRSTGAVEQRTFAVEAAEFAAIYAREYAARILDGGSGDYRVVSVRWAR